MNTRRSSSAPPISARIKLLDAAHHVVRRKGYAATSVDKICTQAGVSKGAFFHHFTSKEALGVACDASISAYCERLAVDIQQALDMYETSHPVTALGLAHHTQAALQGAFIMAKARNSPDIARDSVAHLKLYIEMLFKRGEPI